MDVLLDKESTLSTHNDAGKADGFDSGTSFVSNGNDVPAADGLNSLKSDVEPLNSASSSVKLNSLLTLFKFVGAGIVGAAMMLFLFEGIEVTNDVQRYFSILGFGSLLTALGLCVNHWLGDRIASRLLIGLSLTSVPVVSAVLGGMIYSLTDAAQLVSFPDYVRWQLPDIASLWLAVPVGALVLACITKFSLMIMARSESRWMAIAILASNALMLIPSRNSVFIAAIASFSVLGLLWLIKKHQANPASFKTIEGRWALAVLFLAPAVIVGRSLLLYEASLLLVLSLSLVFYVVSRNRFLSSTQGTVQESVFLCATALFASMLALTGSYYVSDVVFHLTSSPTNGLISSGLNNISRVLLLNVNVVFWMGVLLLANADWSKKRLEWRLSRVLTSLSCVQVALVIVGQSVFYTPSLIGTLLGIGLLSLFSIIHYSRQSRFESAVLAGGVLLVLALHSGRIVDMFASAGWWGLAAVGTAMILGCACLDRRVTQSQPLPGLDSTASDNGVQ